MGVVVLFVLVLLYMFPAIVAARRGHLNANSICIVNLFLGFTGVVWVLCLAWAMSSNVETGYEPYSRRINFER